MTSIEWLINQIEEKGSAWENASIRRVQISIDVSEYMEIKKQAQAMHREEIAQLRTENERLRKALADVKKVCDNHIQPLLEISPSDEIHDIRKIVNEALKGGEDESK